MITIGFSTKVLNDDYKNHLIRSCGIYKPEILHIENNGEYSLTEVYNKLLDKATNDIVVLCHDDIYFDTIDWGRRLLKHFDKTDYGIIGVAGSTDLSENGVWWDDKSKMYGIVNHEQNGKKWTSKYSEDLRNKITPSCVVDGVFISLSKSRIRERFDEDIKGFHFYDIDFSISNSIKGVKIGVLYNIRLTHKSIGMTNDDWEYNRKFFVNKRSDILPYKINLQ